MEDVSSASNFALGGSVKTISVPSTVKSKRGTCNSPYTLTIKCCADGGAIGLSCDVNGNLCLEPSKSANGLARPVHFN